MKTNKCPVSIDIKQMSSTKAKYQDQQKPRRFSKTAPDDKNVWCHECAECKGWFAPCEHDMDCESESDHMSNPDVKCDCKCPHGCHDDEEQEDQQNPDSNSTWVDAKIVLKAGRKLRILKGETLGTEE